MGRHAGREWGAWQHPPPQSNSSWPTTKRPTATWPARSPTSATSTPAALRYATTSAASPTAAAQHPHQLHGPYWQWTAKVRGKTVNRGSPPEQAALNQEWIDNDRHLQDLITQMRHIADKAAELRLRQAAKVLTEAGPCLKNHVLPTHTWKPDLRPPTSGDMAMPQHEMS